MPFGYCALPGAPFVGCNKQSALHRDETNKSCTPLTNFKRTINESLKFIR